MKPGSMATLFYPFESGDLEPPGKGQRFLFLGAEPGFRLPEGFGAELHMVQGFRPHLLTLAKAGYATTPLPEGCGYDGALVLCGRHRGQNELWVAEAITRTKPGGLIVVAGSKDDGIASLRKRLENDDNALADRIAGRSSGPAIVIEPEGTISRAPERLYNPGAASVPLGGHVSKYHGMAFWLQRTPQADAFATSIKTWYGHWPLIEGRFRTSPGMFSHDRVDAGSKLLAECLPDTCRGAAADFCAGWGHLSVALLERTAGLKSIDLYEADHASLEAAKNNVQAAAPAIPVGYFWQDLAAEKVTKKYDLIVMNPPFHQGRAAEPQIGQAMIKAASSALKSGGRLFMVANRGLPYDETVKAGFSRARELRRESAFRVIEAYK